MLFSLESHLVPRATLLLFAGFVLLLHLHLHLLLLLLCCGGGCTRVVGITQHAHERRGRTRQILLQIGIQKRQMLLLLLLLLLSLLLLLHLLLVWHLLWILGGSIMLR